MRLKSLILNNYRQYKDAVIEFGDGITGIVGLNGSGKSTIVEAIAWTLYGNNAARTGKEGIKRTGSSQSSSVESKLIMEIGGTEYQVVRILKGSSQTGAASIIANGKVIADSVRGVEKEVNYLLGMDWKSFYTSFFAKQNELNALTSLTPAARRDTIIRMLRIDNIDKVIKKSKEIIKELKTSIDILNSSMKASNTDELIPAHIIKREMNTLDKSLKETKNELKIAEEQLKEIEKVKAGFNVRFNKEREVFNKYNQLNNNRTSIETRITGLSKREIELNDELKEINTLEKLLPSLEKKAVLYKGLTDKASKLSALKDGQTEALKTKKDVENRLSELIKRGKELLIKEKDLIKLKQCPTCGQDVTLETIESHFDEEKQKMKKEEKMLKSLLQNVNIKFDQSKYNEIIKKKNTLSKEADKYTEAKVAVSKKKKVLETTSRIANERKDFESQIKTIQNDLVNIKYNEKEHENITNELESADKELKRNYDIRNDIRSEIDKVTTQINEKNTLLEQMKGKQEQIDSLTKERETHERFSILTTDYRQYLITRIGPKLAEISGMLLTELTDGKYSGVELDEEYNLYIFDGNAKYPLDRFSGGEADIANLCLRLAISQLIAESSGIETGFIILDEIFGSQDSLRKSSILEALNRLSKQFRQIILITHIEDIKDTLENIIEVTENEEGISSIKT